MGSVDGSGNSVAGSVLVGEREDVVGSGVELLVVSSGTEDVGVSYTVVVRATVDVSRAKQLLSGCINFLHTNSRVSMQRASFHTPGLTFTSMTSVLWPCWMQFSWRFRSFGSGSEELTHRQSTPVVQPTYNDSMVKGVPSSQKKMYGRVPLSAMRLRRPPIQRGRRPRCCVSSRSKKRFSSLECTLAKREFSRRHVALAALHVDGG